MNQDSRPRCEHMVVYPMDNCASCLLADNALLREAAEACAAMLGDTPRDRLGRLDIVATETREAVRLLAVRYGVVSGDYMDQCAKVLRAATAKNSVPSNTNVGQCKKGVTTGRDRPNKLVYNKETKKIDMVRGYDGLVVDSFSPPEGI